MANTFIQSLANPMRAVKMNPVEIPQYISRFMDDWLFESTIHDYEQPKTFVMKWLNDDSVRLQYITNYSPQTIRLMTCDGTEVYSAVFETRQQDEFRPGYYIRQIEIDLATFDPGFYYFQIDTPGFDSYVLDPFEIVTEAPNTLYVEYSHPDLYQGIYFNSPFTPAIRIPAVLDYDKPGSRNTLYEDQNLNETMVKAVPYRIWKLTVGDASGIPPWLIDKIDRIMGCPSVLIDGRYFTKNEGAEWDKNTLDLYPLSGWTIELREKLNRSTIQADNDVVITGTVVAAAVIDTRGFGVSDTGSGFIEILDIN